MRVAALYDIHGNLPALEAVLSDVHRDGVDQIVVGGDVLPGPMPHETLARLRALTTPVAFLRGNGEAAMLAHLAGEDMGAVPEQARDAVRWCAEQLDPSARQFIAGWPSTVRLRLADLGDVLFCHATPRSNTEIFTRLTAASALTPVFAGIEESVVVCGHTHMQFDRTVGSIRIVNAGSVGMPFGDPGAYWVLLGPDVQLRKTPYDLLEASAAIRATAYPKADDFASHNVLRPPSEADVLAQYAKVELR
jgi:predicted phosphodiesterase